MIILGVDPGTRITGYGIIKKNNNSHDLLDFGCIRPPQKLSPAECYLFIFNGIDHLLETHHPDAVSVESQFFHKNAQSVLKLGMAKASVLIAAARRQVPVYEYAPRKAKLAATGNGAASKVQVQKMIQLLLRLPTLPEPEDAADALALAICHAHQEKNYARIPQR
jgi:crossover junction endodeoxyribonuclease RuvC